MTLLSGSSIRKTFVLYISVLTIVFFAAGAALMFLTFGVNSARTSRSKAYSMFNAWADRLEGQAQDVRSSARLFAQAVSSMYDAEMRASSDEFPEEAEELLVSYSQALDFADGAGIWLDPETAQYELSLHVSRSADGSFSSTRSGTEIFPLFTQDEWHRTGLSVPSSGQPVGRIFVDSGDGGPLKKIRYVYPIVSGGKPSGMVVIEWNIKSLAGFLKSVTYTPTTDTLLLYRETGSVLYSRFGEAIGPTVPGSLGSVLEAAVKNGASYDDIVQAGVKKLAFARVIDDSYTLAMTVPFSEAFEQLYRVAVLYASLTIIFLVLLVWAVSFLVQRLLIRRIIHIAEAIDSITLGNYGNVRVLDGSDELSRISGNVALMAEGIRNREHTIQNLDSYLGTVLEALPEALVVVSSHGQVRLANHGFLDLFAPESLSLPGSNLYESVKGMLAYKDIVMSVADSQSGLDFYKEDLRASRGGPFRVRFVPLLAGEEKSCLILFMDMSDLQRAEELEIQKSKFESMAGMASGLAHDFGNIINSVLGSSDMLVYDLEHDKRPTDEELLEVMKTIDIGARRGADLIKRLHMLSRQKSRERKPIPLPDALRSAVDIAKAALDASVELVLDPSVLDETVIDGDRMELEQAFVNLIVNAGHAVSVMRPESEPKGGTVTLRQSLYVADRHDIAVAAKPGSTFVCVEIEDNGVGMDEATMAKVFDPFFTTKPYGVGTGLGMSVSYSAIKRQDGFIRISSKKGRGTAVRVFLPLPNHMPAGS